MVSTLSGLPSRARPPTCQSTVSPTTPTGTSTPQAVRNPTYRKIESSTMEMLVKRISSRCIFWMYQNCP